MSQKLIGEQESKFKSFLRKRGLFIAMATTVLGLFIGIPLLFWLYSQMVIPIGLLLILIFGSGTLGILQWEFVKNLIDIEFHQFAMVAFSGFGICLINAILLLNLYTSIGTSSQTFEIDKIVLLPNDLDIYLLGEDTSFALEKALSTYVTEHFDFLPNSESVTIDFEKGLLGIDKIVDCRFD
jgi:hypothetical protein